MSSWTGFGSACADPIAGRGFPGAPSGAGRGVSPRIARVCTDMGAGILRYSAGYAGDMFGGGSLAGFE